MPRKVMKFELVTGGGGEGRMRGAKNPGSEVGSLGLSPFSVTPCVVLGGSFNLSKPQFLHLFKKTQNH